LTLIDCLETFQVYGNMAALYVHWVITRYIFTREKLWKGEEGQLDQNCSIWPGGFEKIHKINGASVVTQRNRSEPFR